MSFRERLGVEKVKCEMIVLRMLQAGENKAKR